MVMMTKLKSLASREQTSAPVVAAGAPTQYPMVARALSIVAADALCLLLGFAATLWAASALYAEDWDHGDIARLLLLIGLSVALFIPCTAVRGEYGRQPFQASGVPGAISVAAMILIATGFVSYLLGFHTGQMLLFVMWGGFALCLPLARGAAQAGLSRVCPSQWQALLVGTGEPANHAMTLLGSSPSRGVGVVAAVDPARLGQLRAGSWPALLQRHAANMVVLAMDEPPRDMLEWLVRDQISFAVVTRANGLPVHGAAGPRFYNHDVALWSWRNNMRQPLARAAKLAFDVLGAAGLLLVLAPLLALIAAIIKLDGGNVLYAHRRIGAGGRSFPCLKFRSMVLDGDAVLARVLASDPAAAAEWAASRKLRDDPRVTAIGSFLRKTSLDELPQLFNVLRLEMSLVGPRPIVDAEVPRYGEDIHFYYAARPGLTGLWQVSGRSDTGYTQRVRYDAWYVKNWSLRHDIVILAKTIPAVLKRRGAV